MVLRIGDYMGDIVGYIESNLDNGYNEDQLRFILVRRGYSRSAIEKGFRRVRQNRLKMEPPKPQQVPKVRVIEDIKKEETKPKGPGFFSRIAKFFESSPKKNIKFEKDETLQVDDSGNLMR